MWDLPGPEIVPVSPALAGRFLTTGPSGKSSHCSFNLHFSNSKVRTRLSDWTELNSKVEHNFMCLLVICMSCLGKSLFRFSIHFFFFFSFFNFCNIVFVSSIQQHEIAIMIHISLPSAPPIPPFQVITECQTGLVVLHSNLKAIHLTHDNVYMLMQLSPFIPLSPSPAVSTSQFSTSVSPLLPCKYVH